MKSIVSHDAVARLGNSCFQLAAVIAYAADHGLDFSPPASTTDEHWRALYFRHLLHPEICNPSLKRVVIPEAGFPYQPIPFEPEWAEDHLIIIGGYRQSELYFKHRRDEVLAAFGFPWHTQPSLVSLHVRRGDYLKWPEKHPEVTAEWYFAQMTKFPGATFVLFSDDPNYVKDTFGHRKDVTNISIDYPQDPRPEVQDLILGSWCSDHICSASTFSWWQAWLDRNPEKRVVMPKLWLQPGWQGTTEADWRDICPPEWTRA